MVVPPQRGCSTGGEVVGSGPMEMAASALRAVVCQLWRTDTVKQMWAQKVPGMQNSILWAFSRGSEAHDTLGVWSFLGCLPDKHFNLLLATSPAFSTNYQVGKWVRV